MSPSASASADTSGPMPAAVLAVDDYAVNLAALSVIVEPLGIELVTTTSAREAIRLAGQRPFAAILLDVVMPEMDGFETLTALRAIPAARETPVVLLTAHELDPVAIGQLEGKGMVDYILKPVAPVILRSKVAALGALHRQREELAAKDRHIAMLAHDLQTPLAAIGVSAALVLRSEAGAPAEAAAQRIIQGVDRMADMIRDLTDFARAGRGPIPVAPEPMDLGDLCREAVRDFPGDGASRLEVRTSGDLRGAWDRNRLNQAVANLMTNALRYGEGRVTLDVRGAGDQVELSVHNRGAPIPAELLPVIFHPFERGTRDRAGLGLGLYIVHEIAKAHRGSVGVSSAAEDGTTFSLRLPRSM